MVVEYFILFAIVALLTIVAVARFDDDIKTSLEDMVGAAATKMAVDQDQSGGEGPEGGSPCLSDCGPGTELP